MIQHMKMSKRNHSVARGGPAEPLSAASHLACPCLNGYSGLWLSHALSLKLNPCFVHSVVYDLAPETDIAEARTGLCEC